MSGFELDLLRQHPDDGPVLMVNLLKFRERSLDGDGTGREAYGRYADVALGLVQSRGGSLVWAGLVDHPALRETGDADWDAVQLVYYPSRAAFVGMVTSPEYLAANEHRRNGLEKHVILASSTIASSPLPQS